MESSAGPGAERKLLGESSGGPQGTASVPCRHSQIGLLFEVFESAVVGAGQFHDVPIRPQLKIQLRLPWFCEGFRIFHGDVNLHVIVIDAVEPLLHAQIGAMRLASFVNPCSFIHPRRLNDQR